MKDINTSSDKNNLVDFRNKKDVGCLGESIACDFLQSKGFVVLERNYLKKWGEIDIIAVKDRLLTFIEVKSVIDNSSARQRLSSVSSVNGGFRPEENVHPRKQLRLRRTIQTYMASRGYGQDFVFSVDIMVVRLNTHSRRARVAHFQNIII